MGNLKEMPWTEVMATLEALAHAGWTREDFKLLRKDGRLALKALNVARGGSTVGDGFLLVNYNLTVEDLVRECGCDWNNKNITSKNFPTKKTGQHKVETKTYHFNKTMTSKEKIIAEMKKEGFRPAELHELLVHGIKNPDEQRKHAIIALGSVWQRLCVHPTVACLSMHGAGRKLILINYSDHEWYEDDGFLAVRE